MSTDVSGLFGRTDRQTDLINLPLKVAPTIQEGFLGWNCIHMRQADMSTDVSGLFGRTDRQTDTQTELINLPLNVAPTIQDGFLG